MTNKTEWRRVPVEPTCDMLAAMSGEWHPSRHGKAREQYAAMLAAAPEAPAQAAQCWCQACRPITLADMRMVVCPDCGFKRCPKANDHRNACTGSNEPGQPGSAYPAPAQASAVDERAAPEVTEFNVGRWCLSEDDCIEQGIDFAAYERGVADAATAFGRNRARVANGIGGEGKR